MKIKICGITNLEDAIDASIAGADALGFVFYKESPRYISPEDAKKIITKLPPFVQSVGLFVNETIENINKISHISNIDLAQIIDDNHFDKADLNGTMYDSLDIRYIKVIRAKTKDDVLKYKNDYRLIDAFVDGFGGKGKRLELSWFDNIDCSKIILAGGLNSDNAKELLGYNFYSVDVSSGVEISKRKKDKNKIINFVKAINEL